MGRLHLPLAAALALGCAGSGAHLHATALPGARLDRLERFYVQHRAGDSRNIHLEIQQQLRELGLEAEAGTSEPPAGFDAEVSYIDRYMWDMSMYCVQLTIYVRDLRTGYIAATGSSYRPSVVRKTPAGHARLILTELFAGGAEP